MNTNIIDRYVNGLCSKDEVAMIHDMIHDDFSLCFDVIQLMKLRAYRELIPVEIYEEMSGDYDEPDACSSIKFNFITTKQNEFYKSENGPSQDNDNEHFVMVTIDGESRICEPSFTDLINQYLNSDDSDE